MRLSDLTSVSMLPCYLGVALIGAGLRKRKGSDWYCARCGYQRSPEPPFPARCPECGAPWQLQGGLAKGAPHRNKTLIWLGATLLAAGLVPFLPGLLGNSVLQPMLPTTALIYQVRNAEPFRPSEAWTELMRRRLTSAQERDLAVALQDRRKNEFFGLDQPQEGWLAALVMSGTCKQDLIDRYYGESVSLRLT